MLFEEMMFPYSSSSHGSYLSALGLGRSLAATLVWLFGFCSDESDRMDAELAFACKEDSCVHWSENSRSQPRLVSSGKKQGYGR
jgi:hypothetical protein